VKLLVVDDHPVFRKGLVDLLRDDPAFTVCAEAGTIDAALAASAAHRPDVALIDLSLGLQNGLDLITAMRRGQPGIRILVLSGHDERVHADRALKAGALGYIMKDKAAGELLTAVRRVAAGNSYVSSETADRILTTIAGAGRNAASPLDTLSDRQRRVLTLMGRGVPTREIATTLNLSVKTVETHYAHIKDKLGIHNARELMRVAVTWAESDRLG
jgi:DNA-binding NarL/FixJ family response regulator